MKKGSSVRPEGPLPCGEGYFSLLDPVYYRGNDLFPQDQEVSLVHELLHILFEYVFPESPGRIEEIHLESSIERIARLLVKLKRT